MTGRPRILICDDEAQILRALRVILGDAGFEVVPANTVKEALDVVAVRPPEAAIIDLVLPDGDGVDVCRSIREWSEMPLLVLSAVGDERDKVRALDAGADDYVTKPFGMDELFARMRAALRHQFQAHGAWPVFQIGDLSVDLVHRLIKLRDAEVRLSPKEYDLLTLLVQHAGIFASINHLRGIAIDMRVPLFLMVGLLSRDGQQLPRMHDGS
ncbi:MAG: response regulator, partial [Pseudonocardiaceae bacterium]|nr:response regulator [Pseudonocardiaceae bacterium]